MITIQELSLGNNIFSLGAVLGTNAQQQLVDNINKQCNGSSFFGSITDPFRTGFQNFMATIVEPIRAVQVQLSNVARKYIQQDYFRPIDSIEELKKGIPPCMELPIVYYQPIRTMLEEERIQGFGIDPSTLADEDPYESLLKSGKVMIHSTLVGKNGEYKIEWIEKSNDPELTFEEKIALDVTRQFIDDFLSNEDTSSMDPTDYPSLHS